MLLGVSWHQNGFYWRSKIEVIDVIDRWLAPDYGSCNVYGYDDASYILKHDVMAGDGRLTLYDSG